MCVIVLGSTFLGYLDYWSGSLPPSVPRYDVGDILNSTTAEILSQVNDDGLTSSLIMSLRNNSTVKCNFDKNAIPCKPFEKPCLFHIVKDPCEQVNLNYKPSSKVKQFVQAKIDYFERLLKKFRESASKPLNVRGVKDANPSIFNNTWTNWEDYNSA